MLRRILAALLLAAIVLLPGLGLTEDDETVLLAQTLYALGRNESDETLLLLASVAANRVDSPWFPNTYEAVLRQPHQFAQGTRYDERCMRIAREVMAGRRALPDFVLYYAAAGAEARSGQQLYKTVGKFEFRSMI